MAADAPHYALDDTTNSIVNETGKAIPDRRTQNPRHRTRVYTSAVAATLDSAHSLLLFKTNIGHAGECIDEILRPRQSSDPPILMSDALNRNQPSVVDEFIWCKCNAHARRELYGSYDTVPQANWVIERYTINTHCDKTKLDP